jgi:hypothetical protein
MLRFRQRSWPALSLPHAVPWRLSPRATKAVKVSNDVGAEYAVRGAVEPWELVQPEVNAWCAAMDAFLGDVPLEQQREIGRELMAEYEANLRRAN